MKADGVPGAPGMSSVLRGPQTLQSDLQIQGRKTQVLWTSPTPEGKVLTHVRTTYHNRHTLTCIPHPSPRMCTTHTLWEDVVSERSFSLRPKCEIN